MVVQIIVIVHMIFMYYHVLIYNFLSLLTDQLVNLVVARIFLVVLMS